MSDNSKKTIILACSGAADVGALADRTARALAKNGKGSMFCLAAVGAGIESKMKDFMNADEIIAIDGCSVGCARTTVTKAGRTAVAFDLTKIGYVKGQTPVSDDVVFEASTRLSEQLDGSQTGRSCC